MPDSLQKITFISEIDQTEQPALLLPAKSSGPRPLAIGLHTWGGDWTQPCDEYLEQARFYDWHFAFPSFRGPNWTKEACGSPYVISDIESLVHTLCRRLDVDENRLYLVGGSGGGHAALLVAGMRPDLFAAVSAWVPITDVARWHDQTKEMGKDYFQQIRQACGGDPACDPAAKAEAWKRSPMNCLAAAKGKLTVEIAAGIHDGHHGFSVPVSHSIDAYNLLADEADRIPADVEKFIVETEEVPEKYQFKGIDPAFGTKRAVLMRVVSDRVRLTLFNSTHDMLHNAAFGFLAQQKKDALPVWNSGTQETQGDVALRG